jgi:hypothetical protein
MLILGVLLLTASSAFVVHKALAGACFTDVANGSFWYSVTCWMKDKGISTGYADGSYKPDATVSRGEMALFIQRAFSNTSQVTYLATGPSPWVADSFYPGYVNHFWSYSHLLSPSVGYATYFISPSVPVSLYNTKMYFKGVKVCYDASYGSGTLGYLDYIVLKHVYYNSLGFTEYKTAIDDTNRTTIGCTTLYFAAPSDMQGNDQISVILGVYFEYTTYRVGIGNTTVILQPSTNFAILDIADAEAEMVLRGGVTNSEDPSSGFLP